MRTIQLHVRAHLPVELEPLWTLAKNLWWSWNPEAVRLFRRIDPEAYEASGPCPLKLLSSLPVSTLNNLSKDRGFLEQLNLVLKEFQRDINRDAHDEVKKTFGNAKTPQLANAQTIAYFSMEYGLHESVPLYAGGLGVLAGDHLKTASDLGLPLVGVGLFYHQGYFRQNLTRDGWQKENYDHSEPLFMPMIPLVDKNNQRIRVTVTVSGQVVTLLLWRLDVGRVPLILLDANCQENTPEQRQFTARLYAAGTDIRIQQEILLGIGGVRALDTLGYTPQVFHLNEGHSAFLTLERTRMLTSQGLSWEAALEHIKGSQVFTVHTPVPAGNDAFPKEKVLQHVGPILTQYHLPDDIFYALGTETSRPHEFSMPVFALRSSAQRNGVSQLHRRVSQRIWQPLWPQLHENEVPIAGITNGVHTATWMCSELSEMLELYLGPDWRFHTEAEHWQKIEQIPDHELWNMRLVRKRRLMSYLHQEGVLPRLYPQASWGTRSRMGDWRSEWELNPNVLTIGFARRFASYKRGALMFSDLERLKRIVQSEKFPVQILIAGKAHPQDQLGKEIIQKVCKLIESAGMGGRVLFIENYDMRLARLLVRGVDVWLNTPIRPLEASGTSGMKVAINGGLNVSVLDGWWDEGYDDSLGWAIGSRAPSQDEQTRDATDANSLYDLLEHEIVPLYYSQKVPQAWILRIKKTLQHLLPQFSSQRMVLEYLKNAYEPALRFSQEAPNKIAAAQNALPQLRQKWSEVAVTQFEMSPSTPVGVGDKVTVRATVKSPFPASWLDVSLVCVDSVGSQFEYSAKNFPELSLKLQESQGDSSTFLGVLPTHHPAVVNFALRVAPHSQVFPHALDLHLVQR